MDAEKSLHYHFGKNRTQVRVTQFWVIKHFLVRFMSVLYPLLASAFLPVKERHESLTNVLPR